VEINHGIVIVCVVMQGEDKDSSDLGGVRFKSESEEARSAAKDILSEAADLKGVHSTKSVAAV
jgi:hypothetical protein